MKKHLFRVLSGSMKRCIPQNQRQKVSPKRNSFSVCCSGKSQKGGVGWGMTLTFRTMERTGAAALKDLTEQGRESRCLSCLPQWFTVSVDFRFDNFYAGTETKASSASGGRLTLHPVPLSILHF